MATPEDKPERRWQSPHVLRRIPRPITYVRETLSPDMPVLLDLSGTSSPFGPPPELANIIREAAEDGSILRSISQYGINPSPAIEVVKERFDLNERSRVVFSTGGSDEILERYITQFLLSMSGYGGTTRIVGVGYHFPDVANFTNRHQVYKRDGLPAPRQRMIYGPSSTSSFTSLNKSLEESLEETMDRYKNSPKKNMVFYICNPATPTGDIASTETLQKFIEFCAGKRYSVMVDEAYGDYLEDSHSVLPLVRYYPNLVGFRTYSKGIGIPGNRSGYAVMPDKMGEEYEYARRSHDLVGPAQLFVNRLTPEIISRHLKEVRRKGKTIKGILKKELKEKYAVGFFPNDSLSPDEIPIFLIDGGVEDYPDRLARVGIKATTGSGFFRTGFELSSRYARFQIPPDEEKALLAAELIYTAMEGYAA